MSFYVWDTPEVSKHFNSKYYSVDHYYVVTGNRLDDGFKNDSRDYVGKALINQLKHEGIPEYKLHPTHGFIPANSKLFKEDTNKEQKEKQMKQPVKKVFEVGDKCVIKNIENKFYVYEEATENFVDKEVTIMSKFTIPSRVDDSIIRMVSVTNEDGQCICFREEMCYPVKTEKEKAIEEMLCFVTQGGTVYDIAERLYEAGYRKVKGYV